MKVNTLMFMVLGLTGNTLSGVQNRAVTRVIYTQEPDWK